MNKVEEKKIKDMGMILSGEEIKLDRGKKGTYSWNIKLSSNILTSIVLERLKKIDDLMKEKFTPEECIEINEKKEAQADIMMQEEPDLDYEE